MDKVSDVRAAVIQWLRTEFEAEQKAGFPRLNLVPDTQVIRFLDHFADLDEAGKSELTTILIDWSSHNLVGTQPPNPMYERFSQATAFPDRVGGIRYTGMNLLAGLTKTTSHNGPLGFFQAQGITGLALKPPPGLVRDSADLVPVKIPRLRKLVNAALARLFAPLVTDIGSEVWRYEGELNDFQLKLYVRFSRRMGRPQLSYNTEIRGANRSMVSPNLCFESILGTGFGRWDYLTKENAERSVALLAELVEWLVRLPERLPPGSCQSRPN